jgi:hypothetical protein
MFEVIVNKIQLFSLIGISIFLEAAPFLLIAVLLTALFEVFVPENWIERMIPKHKPLQIVYGLLLGLIFPTCECGVVPIARKLIQKGFPISMAITYMLAAPVINPIVLISTFFAFRFDSSMLIGRVAIILIVATITSGLISRLGGNIIRSGHQNSHASLHVHEEHQQSKLKRVLHHASNDFLDMGKYLIAGAFAAALIKVALPPNILTIFETNMFSAIVGMMILAILLSVCSEADAFVAASFISLPKAAQLSFVTIGPVFDLKLLAMFSGTFRRSVVIILVTAPFILNLVLCNLFGVLVE